MSVSGDKLKKEGRVLRGPWAHDPEESQKEARVYDAPRDSLIGAYFHSEAFTLIALAHKEADFVPLAGEIDGIRIEARLVDGKSSVHICRGSDAVTFGGKGKALGGVQTSCDVLSCHGEVGDLIDLLQETGAKLRRAERAGKLVLDQAALSPAEKRQAEREGVRKLLEKKTDDLYLCARYVVFARTAIPLDVPEAKASVRQAARERLLLKARLRTLQLKA